MFSRISPDLIATGDGAKRCQASSDRLRRAIARPYKQADVPMPDLQFVEHQGIRFAHSHLISTSSLLHTQLWS